MITTIIHLPLDAFLQMDLVFLIQLETFGNGQVRLMDPIESVQLRAQMVMILKSFRARQDT